MPNSMNTQVNTQMPIDGAYNSSGMVYNPSLNDSQLFLKMLTVNLTNQDPTNPTDSNEFTNQMLQYATMEALTTVTSCVKELINVSSTNTMYSVIGNAINLTGRNVTMLIPKGTDGSEEDAYISGIVEGVTIDEDGIWIEVNGEKHQFDNLVSVKNGTTTPEVTDPDVTEPPTNDENTETY